MNALFTYGSLMFPEVVCVVLQRAFPGDNMIDAMLRDHRRIAIPGRPYPTGFAEKNHSIEGKLLLNLTPEDLARLDAYEESFYRRVTATVETADGPREAFVYVDSRDPLPFEKREWDPETFRKNYLVDFVRDLGSRR